MDEYGAHKKFEGAIKKKVPQIAFINAFREEVHYRYEKLYYLEQSVKDSKRVLQEKVFESMLKWYSEGPPASCYLVGSGFYALVTNNTWARLYIYGLRSMLDEQKERISK